MGFEKSVIRAGHGDYPKHGRKVTVHCTGFGKNRNLQEKVQSIYLIKEVLRYLSSWSFGVHETQVKNLFLSKLV